MQNEKEKLIESFKQNHTEEEQKLVATNAKLQFKALIFLNHKLCRACRYKTLTLVRQGGKFNRDLLCDPCKVKYDNEVKGGM